jgi:hypothetical protein
MQVLQIAIFTAVIKIEGQAAYTAAFLDFPRVVVEGSTLYQLLMKAGEFPCVTRRTYAGRQQARDPQKRSHEATAAPIKLD